MIHVAPCLSLAALGLLASVAGPALAQQQPAQRSGTTTRPQTQPAQQTPPAQQRSATPAAQQQRQPTQQRSATPAAQQPTQPTQQRGAAPAQQRGAAPTAQQRGPTPAAQQKPNGSAAKPAAGAPAKSAATGPAGTQGVLLGTYRDWKAYTTGQGRSRMCWALSEPVERLPAELKRDSGYLFVSFRPADNIRNEVAVVMGFATRENGPAEATVGTTSYELVTKNNPVTKGADAWVKNQAEEGKVVNSMVRAQSLTVKVTSGRGNPTTDRYSLSGFTEALDRARKECS